MCAVSYRHCKQLYIFDQIRITKPFRHALLTLQDLPGIMGLTATDEAEFAHAPALHVHQVRLFMSFTSNEQIVPCSLRLQAHLSLSNLV